MAKLVVSELGAALLNELPELLLGPGKGFAFVSRPERITLDGNHFYIDLVFYHMIIPNLCKFIRPHPHP